jgi:hypothetical protein
VSVTFQAEPGARSRAVIDYHLECVVEPRHDHRSFATYEAAVAGLTDHDQHCGDAFCFPGTRYIVSRSRSDDEPSLNMTNLNAAHLLRALGLLPELGADAVLHEHEPVSRLAGGNAFGLAGECDALDLLGRIDLALALSPVDEGTPWHPVTPGGNFLDCGRRPGYLQDRLHVLRAIAVHARELHRRVTWC